MNKKNLLLLVTTLFFANGFVIKTNAMEQQPSSGSKIEEIKDENVQMSDVKKTEEQKNKKRKREADENGDIKDDGKAIEKRSNVEAQQIMPFTFGANTLAQMNAFFSNPESQVIDSDVLNGHVKTLVNLIKTYKKDPIRVLLPLLTKLNNDKGQHFLHLLSIDGKAQEIRYLFENFQDTLAPLIDSLDLDYKSALFYAVVNGHDDVVGCLLENGAAILLSEKQFSLMHYAAQMGFSGIIELLVNHNVQMVMAKDAEGKTPLHIAVENGFEKAVETIIAAIKRNPSQIPNLVSLINAVDNNGQTCLHYAACKGDTNIVGMLLQNRADVNAVDGNRMTPLHILLQSDPTARKRNTTCSIVHLLLVAGADVTLIDSANNKPHDYVANDHPIKQTLKNREKEIMEKKNRHNCIIL